MNKYYALVLEDTLSDQLSIEMVMTQFPAIEVTYVATPKAFLQELSQKNYTLFIIDILLNDSLTGIDLIQTIRNTEAWVIISSSLDSKDYYEQYKALQFKKFFIKKPIDEFTFKTNIESYLFSNNKKSTSPDKETDTDYIILKQGNYFYKVHFSEMLLIETTDHATSVITEKNKYTTYTTLTSFEELLKNNNFEKVNRKTLVNMNAVKRINLKENYLELEKHQIKMSRSNKQYLMEKYMNKIV